MQDHDLTLLPQSRIRFRVGYSRDTQSGPALSSVQEFNATGYAFPVFMNVRRDWNEYRVGADGDFAGIKFTVLHRWNYFKDDSPYGPVAGAPPPPGDTGRVVLQQFTRSEPIHGSNPGWFGNLFTNRKYWGIDARITYNSGHNDFIMNEQATGIPFTGINGATAFNRQILVGGAAQRPVTAGDFNLSLYPTGRLTVVNSTSVHSTRIQGDSTYSEYDNGSGFGATLNFRYLGIRTVANTTDANYRLAPWISFYAGYSYSDRLIRTIEGFAFGGPVENTEYERDNQLHSGRVGVQIRPWKPLTIRVNGEIGRDNLPLTPISDRNYHTIGGRIDYRTRKVQLSGTYSQVYNVNSSDPLSAYSSHTRNYTANASWSPVARWSLDASYMKLHLDTVSTLAFFAGINSVQFYQGFSQLYLSNIHGVNLAVHFAATRRVDLYVGYSLTKDTGDGRSAAVPPGITNPASALFASVQTFPLSFQSPLARVSVRITPKIRWNAGWQFYNYHQEFALLTYVQNYHANTGYTSVLWSF